ncbi:hypothetical protein ACHAW6_012331 [Cyclotella cf. meneghiniana]
MRRLRVQHSGLAYNHVLKQLKSCRVLSSSSNYEPEEDCPRQLDFRPHRIILLRHGESQGNVDQNAYVTTADWRIPITDVGKRQAQEAARQLRDKIGEQDAKALFYFSPYLRTKQTLDEILPYFDEDEILGIMEEPRIRCRLVLVSLFVEIVKHIFLFLFWLISPHFLSSSEQQIGNFQNVQQVLDAKSERSKFGRFFYRFPSGEAGLDVYNRVSSFIPTLVRDCIQYSREGHDLDNMNIVIVTHGLALRLFLMRWFQFSVHDFEESYNPDNCQLITMTKMKDSCGHAWMELEEKDRVSLCLPGSCGVPRNVHLHRLQAMYENRHKN